MKPSSLKVLFVIKQIFITGLLNNFFKNKMNINIIGDDKSVVISKG
jgi:hypothetical protein